jgi:hypothetical protein
MIAHYLPKWGGGLTEIYMLKAWGLRTIWFYLDLLFSILDSLCSVGRNNHEILDTGELSEINLVYNNVTFQLFPRKRILLGFGNLKFLELNWGIFEVLEEVDKFKKMK